MHKKQEMKEITDFVEKYREKNGITPTPGSKYEPSCEHSGEGYNLLYCQLINTVNYEWEGWLYKDDEIRQLVLQEVKAS
ncbi:MAG: hypothetical protein ABIB71_06055 [Candidatus Woesearchaeota archaeon]